MMKQVLVIIGAVCLTVGMSLLLPFVLSDQSVGVSVDEAALQEKFELELAALFEKQIKEMYESEWEEFALLNEPTIEAYLAFANGEEMVNQETDVVDLEVVDEDTINNEETPLVESMSEEETSTEGVDLAEASSIEISDSKVEVEQEVAKSEEAMEVAEESDEINLYELDSIPLGTEAVVTEQVVKDAWVNQKIAENREEISESDLYAGANIYNKLDTNYLFGLAEDGLTVEEEAEVKEYLSSNLADDELGVALDLYNRYVNMLN